MRAKDNQGVAREHFFAQLRTGKKDFIKAIKLIAAGRRSPWRAKFAKRSPSKTTSAQSCGNSLSPPAILSKTQLRRVSPSNSTTRGAPEAKYRHSARYGRSPVRCPTLCAEPKPGPHAGRARRGGPSYSKYSGILIRDSQLP
jgi:hypothetical protein